MRKATKQSKLKQSKLHIGYRTFVTYKDEDYFALQLFNGLFGGLHYFVYEGVHFFLSLDELK
jgi:predicted Zn-dependent peptidase